ncbi:hypothetical protein [Nonomuraea sp. NPDC050643]|uniref:hypothetical protein n=1 Tax=Nonomuraea sp. NPDC050643 TaxID=3155660 RepID=UPI00340EC0D1
MNTSPQHPAPAAPSGKVPAALETVIEQARSARQQHLDDIVRRLGRGERLSAEQIYTTLRAQTLCTWWRLLARHIEYAEGGGVRPAEAVSRFVSWITPYLDDPTPPDPNVTTRAPGRNGELDFALAHLDHSLALIRQGAARIFLAQAEILAPACSAQQSPSASTGQETTA